MVWGKDWKKVETIVKTRTSGQIRSHAQKFFLKLKNIRKKRMKFKYKKKNTSLMLPPDELELIELLKKENITSETPS